MNYRASDAGAAAGWMSIGIAAIILVGAGIMLRRAYQKLVIQVESRR
jgi:hypothetical protein